MSHEPTTRGFRGAFALMAFVLLAGTASDTSSQSTLNATRDRPDTMTGTVRTVDVESQTLEIVTGVGHAVRLVRMQVAPDCTFTIPGAASRLASITQGTCVRVEYVAAERGAPILRVAVAIEAVETGEGGKGP
ncbi:MAG TPA: hypothetical protein VFT13_07160 [Candidatus Krumholzibacteria bacterium]|nr:hypothetical protein [Candidatus Krumholzibacteria bacterium]